MPKKLAPWTVEEQAAQVRILGQARAIGVTQAELARAAGIGEVRLHRWTKRQTHLNAAQLARMAARVEGRLNGADALEDGPTAPMVPSGLPAAESTARAAELGALGGAMAAGAGSLAGVPLPPGFKQALAVLEALAGPEPEVMGPEPRDARTKLARRFRRVAIGTLLRTMVSGRTEGARVRAAEALLDYGDGKPTQSILDLTPKPPATDQELVAALAKLIETPPAPEPDRPEAPPRGGSDGQQEEAQAGGGDAGAEREPGAADRLGAPVDAPGREAEPESA